MTTIDLDGKNLEQVTTQPGIVVVDAWAAWCGPCRAFAPVFDRASGRYPGHVFAKLDVQANPVARDALGIEHIPTLLVYRDGILLYREAGSPPAEVLDEIVAQAESLNMDEVRARRQQDSNPTRDERIEEEKP